LVINGADPILNQVAESPTLGFGLRRHVPHEFSVKSTGLPIGAMQTSVCGDVSLDNHELSLESDVANQAQEKRLATAEATDNESNGRRSRLDLFEVAQNGFDFMGSPDLDVVKPDGWYDASRQRPKNSQSFASIDRTHFSFRDNS
jgi:hypothetical protein